jgi:hypothetical protein
LGRGDAWPAPEPQSRAPLPRPEELPLAAQGGYDPEAVRQAFDSFYRHIARLDTTLRTIEAVDAFRQQASELRQELRALKAAGWSQQPWPPPYVAAGRPAGPSIPPALPRLALEAAFLIAVAVVVAVAQFERLTIVLVMALAWAIVGVIEWAASRERFSPRPSPAIVDAPVTTSAAPTARAAVARAPLPESAGWAAYSEPPSLSDTAADAMTMVAAAPADEPAPAPAELGATAVEAPPGPDEHAAEPDQEPEQEPEPEADPEPLEPAAEAEPLEPEPLEPAPDAEASGPEPEAAAEAPLPAEPVAAPPRRRFWRRRRSAGEEAPYTDAAQPRHVRVLPAGSTAEARLELDPDLAHLLDPWERDYDISLDDDEPDDGDDGLRALGESADESDEPSADGPQPAVEHGAPTRTDGKS